MYGCIQQRLSEKPDYIPLECGSALPVSRETYSLEMQQTKNVDSLISPKSYKNALFLIDIK